MTQTVAIGAIVRYGRTDVGRDGHDTVIVEARCKSNPLWTWVRSLKTGYQYQMGSAWLVELAGKQ